MKFPVLTGFSIIINAGMNYKVHLWEKAVTPSIFFKELFLKRCCSCFGSYNISIPFFYGIFFFVSLSIYFLHFCKSKVETAKIQDIVMAVGLKLAVCWCHLQALQARRVFYLLQHWGCYLSHHE